MRGVAPIEDVVLQHEEDIEHDGEESQPELGGVAEQRVPVVIVVGDQEHLHHTQHCTVLYCDHVLQGCMSFSWLAKSAFSQWLIAAKTG